ncbi:UDP-N-acetylmuramate--L-alanine ligase [Nocardioides lianchengensis]|uniref:UDP-N-acetylmuramate--L-alanine ligase n=1 Tax=Nocardioides lianchengensis TaxID=1045774 RepID=A0A1G6QV77_9ACTN|nr:UDP-N-acetylmuramate--L-alanine ligase [Nocardioides lianchengensis]NYG10493.1 UDP-N-acetylmuramate--alanine ligase [Nocardioides lianchengensis]SDC95705.1 UDP-N-acetylmuramate--alanine ligase [Nocardioides lianchengensis]
MRVPVPAEVLPADRLGRVHFVGIGGAGLSGIARIMLARGLTVSGSDGADSPTLDALRAAGARVHVGHDAAQVGDADTLVVSTAVREDNPEYVEALRRGLRVLPRSTALAAVMAGRRVLAVAGTHGKTTTTSLLTVALQTAGADPTYAIGGELSATGVNAAEGSGELFVAEADESDGAFLHYTPYAAIVTNVDADHLDQWGTPEAYAAAFDEFADTLDPEGFLVCVVDDPGAARLADRHEAAGRRVVRVSAREPGALAGVPLWSPGEHYLADALAALAVGRTLGLDEDDLVRGLASYTGTKRRMERKGEVGGVRVYDSYAHHPVEIAGDLQAARVLAGDGRLVVAFQPHLVSRTRIFGTAMGEALGAADEVVVLDVYLAREDPDPDVTGALVADAVPLPRERVVHVAGIDEAARELVARARPGDLVLTLGAGDVTHTGPQVLALLEEAGG